MIQFTKLYCQYAENPMGVDTMQPHFSWVAVHDEKGRHQQAYQILVATSPALLNGNQGDMWDSGRVEGSETLQIPYAGKPLQSSRIYYWKVRIWDDAGETSPFSGIQRFGTGILDEADWKGKWIAEPSHRRGVSPLFRKEWQVEKPVSQAMLHISGIGYYEAYLNGKKVGDHVLDPGCTDYDKRVLYATYDVTDYLLTGANAIGVMLGEGWYGNDHEAFIHHRQHVPDWIGDPKFILQLVIHYRDGHTEWLISDGGSGWMVSTGPILENGIYQGETYDARLEKVGWDMPNYPMGDEWMPAIEVAPPKGMLVSQKLEPIKVVQQVRPVGMTNPKKGVYVFDMGQNMAGWVRLKVQGERGCRVTLKYAEMIHPNGLVNQEPLRWAQCTDTYILKGEGLEVYEPRFTYHGFQYVQMEGFPGIPTLDTLTGQVVRSSVEQTGFFRCSDPLLNQIQRNVLWTEAGNLHSIPTDCPQRDERMGWLNDATVRVEETVYNYDMSRFFAKWEEDIQDTQDESGAIADTAPYVFGSRPADPVCSSYLLIPWLLYRHYGNRDILKQHYAGLKKWVECLGAHAKDYIVQYSYYGDWASPEPYCIMREGKSTPLSAITPGQLMSTGYYYYNARLLERIADVLGEKKERLYYRELAEKIKDAFNAAYLNPNTNQYATGSQACQVFPLYLGIAPEENRKGVVERLVQNVIDHDYHLTTGNLCTKYLLEVLTEEGYVDIAYRIATQTTYPSWGYMVANGATTIWERWENNEDARMNSHNHPMYGTVSSWFYKYLAGIQVAEDCPAFRTVDIRPYIPKELQYVDARLETIRGRVSVSWRKQESSLVLWVTLPFNTQGRIALPKHSGVTTVMCGDVCVWEKGHAVNTAEGVLSLEDKGNHLLVTVASGFYSFAIKGWA